MAGDPKNPVVGELVFDGAEFNGYVVDLAPGECQGMQKTREGCELVWKEIIENQKEWGAKAGVLNEDVKELEESNARIARIDVFLPALRKAVEMLTETRYKLDDKRQMLALNTANSVDRRGKDVPELFAKYEMTRKYRSEVAMKAVKTRKKKEKDKVEAKKKAMAEEAPAKE